MGSTMVWALSFGRTVHYTRANGAIATSMAKVNLSQSMAQSTRENGWKVSTMVTVNYSCPTGQFMRVLSKMESSIITNDCNLDQLMINF